MHPVLMRSGAEYPVPAVVGKLTIEIEAGMARRALAPPAGD